MWVRILEYTDTCTDVRDVVRLERCIATGRRGSNEVTAAVGRARGLSQHVPPGGSLTR